MLHSLLYIALFGLGVFVDHYFNLKIEQWVVKIKAAEAAAMKELQK